MAGWVPARGRQLGGPGLLLAAVSQLRAVPGVPGHPGELVRRAGAEPELAGPARRADRGAPVLVRPAGARRAGPAARQHAAAGVPAQLADRHLPGVGDESPADAVLHDRGVPGAGPDPALPAVRAVDPVRGAGGVLAQLRGRGLLVRPPGQHLRRGRQPARQPEQQRRRPAGRQHRHPPAHAAHPGRGGGRDRAAGRGRAAPPAAARLGRPGADRAVHPAHAHRRPAELRRRDRAPHLPVPAPAGLCTGRLLLLPQPGSQVQGQLAAVSGTGVVCRSVPGFVHPGALRERGVRAGAAG